MKHIDIKKLLTDAESYVDTSVTVCGWVRTARNSKSVSFIELNDGTCLNNIQLVIDKNEVAVNKNAFNVGAALTAVGSFVRSERNGYEIQIQTIEVLGNCPFDRMLMYVTGVSNIRDTLLFPRTVGNLF